MREMRKMTIILSIIIGMSMTWSSCGKIDVPEGTPECITKKIKKEKNNCLDKVYEYEYKGELVYLFVPANCPDALSNLYKGNCDFICSPSGGISGTGDGQCVDFSQNAKNEKLIWSK